MVKISVAELEQAIALLKKTSTDMHVLCFEDHSQCLNLQYTSVDGQNVRIEIWHEETRNFAKVHSSERLAEVLRGKK
jgi:hypothetical protein